MDLGVLIHWPWKPLGAWPEVAHNGRPLRNALRFANLAEGESQLTAGASSPPLNVLCTRKPPALQRLGAPICVWAGAALWRLVRTPGPDKQLQGQGAVWSLVRSVPCGPREGLGSFQ